jgi:glycosyltransferase involved in cell wall biosynthesis
VRVLDVMYRAALPFEHGGAVRTYNLLSNLSRRHEVRQFSTSRQDLRPWRLRRAVRETPVTPTFRVVTYTSPVAELYAAYTERVWGSRGLAAGAALRLSRPPRLRELLAWADVVLVNAPWQFEYCLRARPDARLVFSSHNVERARFESYAELRGDGARREARLRRIERLETAALANASLTITVSEADRLELVERYGVEPGRVVVVPSGADVERYRPVGAEAKAALKRKLGLPAKPAVIFLGSRFLGNTAGLAWVQRLARATDRFTFLVVGAVARRGVHGSLFATGRVPDVAPWLQAADLALCPIQYGAGTKIKLFESLSAGLPAVAFAESLHGTDLRHGEHLLVAEKSEAALLASLERLAADRGLAAELGARARAFIEERHDWRRSAEVLEAALLELVGARERRDTYRAPVRAAV